VCEPETRSNFVTGRRPFAIATKPMDYLRNSQGLCGIELHKESWLPLVCMRHGIVQAQPALAADTPY